ncbi:MAG: preprotein translocase subunit TatC [Planctomycetota bacterium]|nr:MAG: preprotein translocase subunit TatC [Planctomycetota bacterium]
MTKKPAKPSSPRLPGSDPVEEVRMTIGEHLDELRAVLIRSLLALVLAVLVCAWPAKYVLALTVKPLMIALRDHGQPPSLLATSPTEPLVWYIKIVLFLSLVVAAPYIIRQFWSFVAKGLYPDEKQWAYKLVPISVGLFLTGVIFMYTFVLVLTLSFLIGFSTWLPMPSTQPNAVQRWLGVGEDVSVPDAGHTPPPVLLPLFAEDPEQPPKGGAWFNEAEQKIKVVGENHTYSVAVARDDIHGVVTNHFKIGDYLTFVLVLAVAFGLAFQVPLVVLFLARTRIVPRETMISYRKVVILVIVIIAGMIAPPDLLSHLLLSGPMYLLFELGLLLARPKPGESTERGRS